MALSVEYLLLNSNWYSESKLILFSFYFISCTIIEFKKSEFYRPCIYLEWIHCSLNLLVEDETIQGKLFNTFRHFSEIINTLFYSLYESYFCLQNTRFCALNLLWDGKVEGHTPNLDSDWRGDTSEKSPVPASLRLGCKKANSGSESRKTRRCSALSEDQSNDPMLDFRTPQTKQKWST